MSDLPFGFGNSDDNSDDDSAGKKDRGAGGPFDPSNFGGQFNPADLGAMFTQIGQMFSGMGAGAVGGGQGEPVNYTLASQLARQHIGKHTPVSAAEKQAAADAVALADLWLGEVTVLPGGVVTTEVWTPVDWLEKTLPTFKRLCDPVAKQLAGGMSSAMPSEAQQMLGPMMAIITQMSGASFGTQLGQSLGTLAKEVLTSSDIGLPLAHEGHAVLLPEAIAAFGADLDVPKQDLQVFLAAREAAHVRLYTHVPWLRERLLRTVEQYADGITVDFSEIQQAAEGIDPNELFSNPEKLQALLGENTFEPRTTPEQTAALARLETLLALIESWVELVVEQALSDRIPSVGALTETMRRRRATGGPAEQTFAELVGLELRPRKVREARDIWTRLETAGTALGTDDPLRFRDGIWDHPDLLPDADDLDNPAGYLDRRISDLSDSSDPIAELERLANEGWPDEKKSDTPDDDEPDSP